MAKHKQPPTPPTQQAETWGRKRLRSTKARARPDLPCRPNAFFEHLDRDIRNHIYGYLAFPPLHQLDDGENSSGFAATCRQAKEEADEEGIRQLWIFLQQIKSDYAKETGHELRLPSHLTSKADLAGLQDLTVTLTGLLSRAKDGSLTLPPSFQKLLSFAFSSLRTLTIHYTGPPSNNSLSSPRTITLAHLVLYDAFSTIINSTKKHTLGRLTISFDYRPHEELEEVLLKGSRFELDQLYKSLSYVTEDKGKVGVCESEMGGYEDGIKVAVCELFWDARNHMIGRWGSFFGTETTDIEKVYGGVGSEQE
jgi:hypothetical protein